MNGHSLLHAFENAWVFQPASNIFEFLLCVSGNTLFFMLCTLELHNDEAIFWFLHNLRKLWFLAASGEFSNRQNTRRSIRHRCMANFAKRPHSITRLQWWQSFVPTAFGSWSIVIKKTSPLWGGSYVSTTRTKFRIAEILGTFNNSPQQLLVLQS